MKELPMKNAPSVAAACLALALLVTFGATGAVTREKRPLAHMVMFTLKDRGPESRAAFVKSCHEYLKDHEGTIHFSVGTIAEDVVEPVSDRDFDVALHLIFESKEAEAKYIKHERHTKFVDENRDKFARVRVFDSYLSQP
jgi:hypothetical protein